MWYSEPKSLCAHEWSNCFCYLLKLLCFYTNLNFAVISAVSLLEELHSFFYGNSSSLWSCWLINFCLLDFNFLMVYLCRLGSCFLLGFFCCSQARNHFVVYNRVWCIYLFGGFMQTCVLCLFKLQYWHVVFLFHDSVGLKVY